MFNESGGTLYAIPSYKIQNEEDKDIEGEI
jgi:hypothetical protein